MKCFSTRKCVIFQVDIIAPEMSGSVRCLQPGGGATAAAAAEQTLVSERTERSQRHVHIAEVVASATSSGSSVNELASGSSSCSEAHRSDSPPPDSRVTAARRTTRNRTISGSKSEDHLMTTESGRVRSFGLGLGLSFRAGLSWREIGDDLHPPYLQRHRKMKESMNCLASSSHFTSTLASRLLAPLAAMTAPFFSASTQRVARHGTTVQDALSKSRMSSVFAADRPAARPQLPNASLNASKCHGSLSSQWTRSTRYFNKECLRLF